MLLEERERRREREAQLQPREQAPAALARLQAALRAARAPVVIEHGWHGGVNAGDPYVPPDTRNLTWMRNEGTTTAYVYLASLTLLNKIPFRNATGLPRR